MTRLRQKSTQFIEFIQQAIEANIGEVFVACSEIEVHDLIVSNGGKAIMTDPNLADATYLEPLTTEAISIIIEKEVREAAETKKTTKSEE